MLTPIHNLEPNGQLARLTATKRQLTKLIVLAAQHAGFQLIPKKEPLPVLIIDHIDHPTPN